MLFNVCGAPCTGKSTLIKRLLEERPEFVHISIDELRHQHQGDERNSWYEFMKKAVMAEYGIAESSGLSWRLQKYVLMHPTIIKRGIVDIILYGDNNELVQRIEKRKLEEKAVPFAYKGLSLEGLVKRCSLEELTAIYPTAYCIEVSGDREEEVIYQEFKEHILKTRTELALHQ